ncbi:MAG: 50S ribosomal protein L3 [Bradymonadales bacterium]|nr:MAG: 50S ribosomal protein L3 [Bradymonadales bacterium]
MSALIGRKIAMTQVFGPDGELVPATIIQAGPCRVLEHKTAETAGYESSILGFEEIPGAKLKKKALLGWFKKLKSPAYRVVREFSRVEAEVGSLVGVEQFKAGDSVKIQGVSKGKGWAGAIKRWNFSRGRETHGGNFNRALGGTGMNTWPARTYRGRKMSGRLGNETTSLVAVQVVAVMPEDALLIVKGPVPGCKTGLLKIEMSSRGKKKLAA